MKTIFWRRSFQCSALLLLAPLTHAEPPPNLSLGVVPQFTATETLIRWAPVIERLQAACGLHIRLQPSTSIPAFEASFLGGSFDLAFMNPYHAVMAQRSQGYQPVVRDGKQRLKGVLVVRADSPYTKPQDLNGSTIAFPAPNAFGASLLMRAVLERAQGVKFTPEYVKTHSNAYRYVLTGQAPAAGGVEATLQAEPPEIRSQLRVLFATPSFAPHPLTAHPRVKADTRDCIERTLLRSSETPEGRSALEAIQVNEPVVASYLRDYAPLEQLSLESYVVQAPLR